MQSYWKLEFKQAQPLAVPASVHCSNKCANDYAMQQSLSQCTCYCRLASLARQCILPLPLSPTTCPGICSGIPAFVLPLV